jgi:peptidyl-prolyl cis-trans isomerase SurA
VFIKQNLSNIHFKHKWLRTLFLASALALVFNTLFLVSNSFSIPNQQIYVVAKVDNQVITNIDLISRFLVVVEMSKIKINSSEEKQIILSQVLQKMVDEQLQIKEAKNLGIELDEQKLQQAKKEIAKDFNQNPENLINFFNSRKISYESFESQVKSQILWSNIIKKAVAPKIKVSQSEIDELLELRKIKTRIDKYHIFEIFIPNIYENFGKNIDSRDFSRNLAKELKGGKNFTNIVKQFSRSPTAEFGGEIGFVGQGDVDDKIYQEIARVAPNGITQSIPMEDGYYIFKVGEKKSFNTLSQEDEEQVKNIIFSRKLQLMARSYLMDLRKNSYIEISDKELNKIVAKL